MCFYLADSDLDVIVIEKGKIGNGSTSSNTALIQYSGEKMFTRSHTHVRDEYIERHLQLLKEAINEIETASKTVQSIVNSAEEIPFIR